MGIGDTVKSIINPNDETGDTTDNLGRRTSKVGKDKVTSKTTRTSTSGATDTLDDPTMITNSNRASHKLPSGTGIGTSGKGGAASHQSDMESDYARGSTQGIAGYGTDAAAAAGGSLGATHSGARTSGLNQDMSNHGVHVGPTVHTSPGDYEGQPMGGSRVSESFGSPTGAQHTRELTHTRGDYGHAGVLDQHHDAGHTKRDIMPSGDASELTMQLHPVTHEHVRHFETEDIERKLELERHVHHVQHHTQPIITTAKLPDTHRDHIHPVTRVEEQHVNKVEDNTLFHNQIFQHRDSIEHSSKERTVVDKGTVVTENVHHHIHHVIQPIIEKTVTDQEFTHTTIPIHEVTHEAPIVHQSQVHAPIPLNQFVQSGGVVDGGISQDSISSRVLKTGECTREVDGIAADLEKGLGLEPHNTSPKYLETKVVKRTTTVEEPHLVPPVRN